MKKTVAFISALSLALSAAPMALADTETTTETAAVSGYVSLTEGVKLAGTDKTPVIYVDKSDYAGVIRAAGDLQDDIERVTDVKSTVTNEITVAETDGGTGITIGEESMSVTLDSHADAEAECYIAAYDRDGVLTGVKIAAAGEDGTGYTCEGVLEKPLGGELKAFIWKDMKPVYDVQGIMVTGTVDLSGVDVVIGTIGESTAVDALISSGELDVSEIEGKWESFTIQSIDNTVVIAGSDKRGTIYGIYDLSEKMGVSPWYWWADVAVGHADDIYVNLGKDGYTEGEPSVKYRGIFINDEYNLTQWSESLGDGNMNNATYEKIFELLLRLKANYCWPAMHSYSTAFNVTENNAALADEYGIVMGSSHCEPLLRNNLGELYDYQTEWLEEHPDKTLYINTTDESSHNVSWMWTDTDASGNAVDNKEFLQDYWRARVKENGVYENTYTLGMRGVHDGKFNTNMSSQTAMAEIIEAQRAILEDELCGGGTDLEDVPQIFIPYKEILDLYNAGLEVPDDVTLMWSDDNYGYIRQLPTSEEQARSGGAGVYYHLSYRGRPTSYLWLSTTQPGLVREEMTKAYDAGAQEVWIANVGDLKPAETQIEYFLDLARDISLRDTALDDYIAENAKRDFGFDDAEAAEYADIQNSFYKIANSRRPEHMQDNLFSLENFGDEGARYLETYENLTERSEKLYNSLDDERKSSFFELQLYPLRCAKNMAAAYINADRSRLYSDEGRGTSVNKYAAASAAATEEIEEDTVYYNSMLDGKWNKIMNYEPAGLKSSYGDWPDLSPDTASVTDVGYTDMEIAAEGGEMSFDYYNQRSKYIDIYNTGSGSFDYKITSDSDWIKFSKTSDTVYDDDRVYAMIDYDKAPEGNTSAVITVTRYIGNTAVETEEIPVNVSNNQIDGLDGAVYVEADGYISIEAEHYSNSISQGTEGETDYKLWKEEDNFGRSGNSVRLYQDAETYVTAPSVDASAYLEYEVYFTSSGKFTIDLYRMPTINELSGSTLRCAVGVDNGTAVTFSGNTKTTDNSTGTDAWGKGVLQNTEILSSAITVSESGLHTIRLYGISPGVVVDKFVITTGDSAASYFGAPESYNTVYNSDAEEMPEAAAATDSQTGSVDVTFDASLITSTVNTDTDGNVESVTAVKVGNVSSAVALVAAYDSSGALTANAFSNVDLSDVGINEAVTVDVSMEIPENTAAIGVILFDNWDDLNALAPIYAETYNSGLSLTAVYDDGTVAAKSNLNDYMGKQSIVLIVPYETESVTSSDIAYIVQEEIGDDSYKAIPTGELDGKYTLKISIAGGEVLEETFLTVKNIDTDTEAYETEIYSEDFSEEPSDVTIGGTAAYDSANGAVKMVGGTVNVTLDEPAYGAQGETVTVVSKIAYGKESGKYMNYTISDSEGNAILYSHITGYNSGAQLIQIGGVDVYSETSALPDAITRNNSALTAGYTTYTTVIDFANNIVTLTLSSTGGTATYTGKLPSGTAYNVASLDFSSTYSISERSCYLDDISVTRQKSASYTIAFNAVSDGESVNEAEITVTDGVTGVAITQNSDGTFNLCDGVYTYTVTADGYNPVTDTLEISQALESKTVTVEMEAPQ